MTDTPGFRVSDADSSYRGRVSDIAVLASGRVILSDNQSGEIHGYDDSGQRLFTTGGRGRGPGQVVMLRDIMPCHGGIGALTTPGFFSTYSPDGEFRSTVHLGAELGAYADAMACNDSGQVILGGRRSDFGSDAPIQDVQGPVVLTRLDGPELTGTRNLGDYSVMLTALSDGRQVRSLMGWRLSLAMTETTAYINTGKSAELIALPLSDTGSARTIRWQAPSAAVTRSRWKDIVELRSSRVSPEYREGFRLRLESTAYPDSSAVTAGTLTDGHGLIWLRSFNEDNFEPEHWVVIDTTGAIQATFLAPDIFELRQVGPTWVAGIQWVKGGIAQGVIHDLIKP